jgi:hypothetical protein
MSRCIRHAAIGVSRAVKQADRSGKRKIEPFVERNPVVLPSSAQNVRDEISSHSILFFSRRSRATIALSDMRTAANKHQPNI